MMEKLMVAVALAIIGVTVASDGYGNRYGYQRPDVYGNWGYWAEWGDCSATCGGGYQSRSRDCRRPYYVYGNYRGCDGDSQETRECNTDSCPVDGGWSEWAAYGECSATCGGGERTRARYCNNPEPAYGGADCEGDSRQTESCYEQACPVDGGWSEWAAYGECSVTCGGGERTRARYCNNPEPAYGGADCEGDSSETESCYEQACPADGSWSRWSYWTTCSGNCGEGYRVRSRSCYPALASGGADCEGDKKEVETCQHYQPCYKKKNQPRTYRPRFQYR